MKSPIIVYEPDDVLIFSSVKEAEMYLEPIDVNRGETVAYDGEGRLLRLSAKTFRVTIECAEEQPLHSLELRQVLVAFLPHCGVPEDWAQTASLQDLVNKALDFKTR